DVTSGDRSQAGRVLRQSQESCRWCEGVVRGQLVAAQAGTSGFKARHRAVGRSAGLLVAIVALALLSLPGTASAAGPTTRHLSLNTTLAPSEQCVQVGYCPGTSYPLATVHPGDVVAGTVTIDGDNMCLCSASAGVEAHTRDVPSHTANITSVFTTNPSAQTASFRATIGASIFGLQTYPSSNPNDTPNSYVVTLPQISDCSVAPGTFEIILFPFRFSPATVHFSGTLTSPPPDQKQSCLEAHIVDEGGHIPATDPIVGQHEDLRLMVDDGSGTLQPASTVHWTLPGTRPNPDGIAGVVKSYELGKRPAFLQPTDLSTQRLQFNWTGAVWWYARPRNVLSVAATGTYKGHTVRDVASFSPRRPRVEVKDETCVPDLDEVAYGGHTFLPWLVLGYNNTCENKPGISWLFRV